MMLTGILSDVPCHCVKSGLNVIKIDMRLISGFLVIGSGNRLLNFYLFVLNAFIPVYNVNTRARTRSVGVYLRVCLRAYVHVRLCVGVQAGNRTLGTDILEA